MKRKTIILTVATVLSVALTAFIAASAGPQVPPWVDQDSEGRLGVVELPEMPTMVPVIDANGEIVGHALSSEIFGAPTDWTPDQGGEPPTADPATVYGSDGSVIGHVGETGFVADTP